jgi:hypothetical protein
MKETLEPFLNLLMTQTHEYEHLQALLTKPNTRYHESKLLLLLKLLPKFIASIEHLELRKYHYSPEVEALAACLSQNPITDYFHFETVCHYPKPPEHNPCIELEQMRHFLSHFLKDLRERLLSPACRQIINQQQSKANRSYRSMCEYVDALFAKQARQVVIRVDVGYGEDTHITLEQFESDLERLYDHTRTKPIFAHLNGFICKIEYGVSKKLHAHLLLFFDSSKRDGYGAWNIAQSICDHWCNHVASAEATFRNVHNDAKKYKELGRLGIGIVHVSDTAMMNILKNYVVGYLCARKQYIKPKNRPNMKLLRRGNMPEIHDVKRGAPRKLGVVI